tara:strand:+ start:945 stop:1145 length:201 start_codon:yes stop_codon:yes gene_type:complete
MREALLKAVRLHVEGNIAKHHANVEVILNSSVGVAEHTDMIESVESEMKKMAEQQDILELLDNYFN